MMNINTYSTLYWSGGAREQKYNFNAADYKVVNILLLSKHDHEILIFPFWSKKSE